MVLEIDRENNMKPSAIMRSIAAQKALTLFALCLALVSDINLSHCAERDNTDSSAFQKWTRIFRNEHGRGIQLLAEKYEKFGDYEKKSYFFIVANGTHFACKMLTDKPKKTDSQIIFEVQRENPPLWIQLRRRLLGAG